MAQQESLESIPPSPSKYIASAASLALVFAIGGCISAEQNAQAGRGRVDRNINSYPTLSPDLSGFLSPDDTTKCYGGGARPCAMLIRTEPRLESTYVNADPSQMRVNWPLESYKGKLGDDVLIDCYKSDGEKVHALDGSSSSSVWYQVIVPLEHIENEELHWNVQHENGSTVLYGGRTALYAWAAAEWFGQVRPDEGIKPC